MGGCNSHQPNNATKPASTPELNPDDKSPTVGGNSMTELSMPADKSSILAIEAGAHPDDKKELPESPSQGKSNEPSRTPIAAVEFLGPNLERQDVTTPNDAEYKIFSPRDKTTMKQKHTEADTSEPDTPAGLKIPVADAYAAPSTERPQVAGEHPPRTQHAPIREDFSNRPASTRSNRSLSFVEQDREINRDFPLIPGAKNKKNKSRAHIGRHRRNSLPASFSHSSTRENIEIIEVTDEGHGASSGIHRVEPDLPPVPDDKKRTRDTRRSADVATAAVETWDKADVIRWLWGVGMETYKKAFLSHDIDGPKLGILTEPALAQMGVDIVADRYRLLERIKRLQETGHDPSTSLSPSGRRGAQQRVPSNATSVNSDQPNRPPKVRKESATPRLRSAATPRRDSTTPRLPGIPATSAEGETTTAKGTRIPKKKLKKGITHSSRSNTLARTSTSRLANRAARRRAEANNSISSEDARPGPDRNSRVKNPRGGRSRNYKQPAPKDTARKSMRTVSPKTRARSNTIGATRGARSERKPRAVVGGNVEPEPGDELEVTEPHGIANRPRSESYGHDYAYTPQNWHKYHVGELVKVRSKVRDKNGKILLSPCSQKKMKSEDHRKDVVWNRGQVISMEGDPSSSNCTIRVCSTEKSGRQTYTTYNVLSKSVQPVAVGKKPQGWNILELLQLMASGEVLPDEKIGEQKIPLQQAGQRASTNTKRGKRKQHRTRDRANMGAAG